MEQVTCPPANLDEAPGARGTHTTRSGYLSVQISTTLMSDAGIRVRRFASDHINLPVVPEDTLLRHPERRAHPQCTDLVVAALRDAAADTQGIGRSVWGRPISRALAGPGDIIQFGANCRYDITIHYPNGEIFTGTGRTQGPHTAIIDAVSHGHRCFTLFEQNFGAPYVTHGIWYFENFEFMDGGDRVIITRSQGVVRFYSPAPAGIPGPPATPRRRRPGGRPRRR